MNANSTELRNVFNLMSLHDLRSEKRQFYNLFYWSFCLVCGLLWCISGLALYLSISQYDKHFCISSTQLCHHCSLITWAPLAMCLASELARQMIRQQQSYVVTQRRRRREGGSSGHCPLCFTIFSAYYCSLMGENSLDNKRQSQGEICLCNI